MAAESNTRRRWFQFWHWSRASGLEFDASPLGDRINAESESRDHTQVAHAIEDVLFGVAMIALAFDERIPGVVARDVVCQLLEARHEGRDGELVSAAHEEVASLPDWECEACHEPNPATFEVCWNCDLPSPAGLSQPSDQSKVVLGIESMSMLRFERETDTDENLVPQSGLRIPEQ